MSIEVHSDRVRKLLAIRLATAVGAGAFGIASAIQDVLAPYPRHTPRPQPFVSARQRRAFFAKLRAGEIRVPYSRGSSPTSQMLNRRWLIQHLARGARLKNTASYAGLVHGRTRQTRYHAKTGWVREDTAVQQVVSGGEARQIMADAIYAALQERV